MNTITFTLEFLSDAELGSGTGNEIINDVLARDHKGRVVLRGSHLRGLLREQVRLLFGENTPVERFLFGEEGNAVRTGALRVPDTAANAKAKTRTITRTALEKHGTVKPGTLRTTEAVAVGTLFSGTLQVDAEKNTAPYLALCTALLSLEAVGGGRTRGSGSCRVTLPSIEGKPGDLYLMAHESLQSWEPPSQTPVQMASREALAETQTVWLQLEFTATEPLCCPEVPVCGNNVIQSGISIPASAVLGAVVSLLDKQDSALASQTLLSPLARAWPLNPVPGDAADAFPVRVALSHRMSKLPNNNHEHDFKDAAIEPYSWKDQANGSPLKGIDGVLFRKGDKIHLWRSGDIPRILTSHAVHLGGSNLFTVESMAPQVFRGLLCLPASVWPVLENALKSVDHQVVLGKARGVRGGGRLIVKETSPGELLKAHDGKVWVLQSPMAIPDGETLGNARAETVMARLLRDAGWPALKSIEENQGVLDVRTMANAGVRFGWNRHGAGNLVETSRRLRARRVFLPGSVFVLAESLPVDQWERLLLSGASVPDGEDRLGRLQGYGAVLPHPGVAQARYTPEAKKLLVYSSSLAGKWAWDWFEKTRESPPSPSQISAVAERLPNQDEASKYLRNQQDERSIRVWERWQPVFNDVLAKMQQNPEEARTALRTWRDLAVIHRKEKN